MGKNRWTARRESPGPPISATDKAIKAINWRIMRESRKIVARELAFQGVPINRICALLRADLSSLYNYDPSLRSLVHRGQAKRARTDAIEAEHRLAAFARRYSPTSFPASTSVSIPILDWRAKSSGDRATA